jgi:hypothetical protein
VGVDHHVRPKVGATPQWISKPLLIRCGGQAQFKYSEGPQTPQFLTFPFLPLFEITIKVIHQVSHSININNNTTARSSTMSNTTSSASASTNLTPAQSTNVVAPEQVKTSPAKTTMSKVKYPPAKTWALNSKLTKVLDKPTLWTPDPFNTHRISEYPKESKVYVHIITHECLEGDAVRCVIKGVPTGSVVEANDYIREYSPGCNSWICNV